MLGDYIKLHPYIVFSEIQWDPNYMNSSSIHYWLVVWNINFIFPYIGVFNHPNWLSYFSEGFKPPTRLSPVVRHWSSLHQVRQRCCWAPSSAVARGSHPSVRSQSQGLVGISSLAGPGSDHRIRWDPFARRPGSRFWNSMVFDEAVDEPVYNPQLWKPVYDSLYKISMLYRIMYKHVVVINWLTGWPGYKPHRFFAVIQCYSPVDWTMLDECEFM